jgi:hypothetical protein
MLLCCVLHQAAPFSRLAGSDAGQLGITLSLAEKALQLQPDNVNMVRFCPALRSYLRYQHCLQPLIIDHCDVASACTAK